MANVKSEAVEAEVEAAIQSSACDVLRSVLHRIFECLDVNGNGLIDVKELADFTGVFTEKWSKKKNRKLLHIVTSDKEKDQITEEDFTLWMFSYLSEIFDACDQDGSGKIDYTEVGVICKCFRKHYSARKHAAFLHHLDHDKDGLIDRSEFIFFCIHELLAGCDSNSFRRGMARLTKVFNVFDYIKRHDMDMELAGAKLSTATPAQFADNDNDDPTEVATDRLIEAELLANVNVSNMSSEERAVAIEEAEEKVCIARSELATKIHNNAPIDMKKVLSDLFATIDADASGFIDVKELRLFEQMMRSKIKRRRVGKLLARMDINGDGKVSEEEFSIFIIGLLSDTFTAIDEDKSGKLDYSEMIPISKCFRKKWSNRKHARFLASLDKDGDGLIDRDEYCYFVIMECLAVANAGEFKDGLAKLLHFHSTFEGTKADEPTNAELVAADANVASEMSHFIRGTIVEPDSNATSRAAECAENEDAAADIIMRDAAAVVKDVLHNIFEQLDSDKSGYIDSNELRQFGQFFEEEWGKKTNKRLMRVLNASDKVSEENFCHFLYGVFSGIFDHCDTDGSNTIDMDELMVIARCFRHKHHDAARLKSFCHYLDADGDGRINRAELIHFLATQCLAGATAKEFRYGMAKLLKQYSVFELAMKDHDIVKELSGLSLPCRSASTTGAVEENTPHVEINNSANDVSAAPAVEAEEADVDDDDTAFKPAQLSIQSALEEKQRMQVRAIAALNLQRTSPDDCKKMIVKLFECLDTDNSGSLDVNEIHAFGRLMRSKFSRKRAKKLFSIMDISNTGVVASNEFGLWIYGILSDLFDALDENGDGVLSTTELIPVCKAFRKKFSTKKLIRFTHNLDEDGNDVISKLEFCTFILLNCLGEAASHEISLGIVKLMRLVDLYSSDSYFRHDIDAELN